MFSAISCAGDLAFEAGLRDGAVQRVASDLMSEMLNRVLLG